MTTTNISKPATCLGLASVSAIKKPRSSSDSLFMVLRRCLAMDGLILRHCGASGEPAAIEALLRALMSLRDSSICQKKKPGTKSLPGQCVTRR